MIPTEYSYPAGNSFCLPFALPLRGGYRARSQFGSSLLNSSVLVSHCHNTLNGVMTMSSRLFNFLKLLNSRTLLSSAGSAFVLSMLRAGFSAAGFKAVFTPNEKVTQWLISGRVFSMQHSVQGAGKPIIANRTSLVLQFLLNDALLRLLPLVAKGTEVPLAARFSR